MNDPKDFWKKVLARVELEVTPMVYGAFVSRTALGVVGENSLDVLCDDDFIKKTVEKKYFQIIQEAVNIVAQKDLPINFSVKKPAHIETKKEVKELGPLFGSQQDPTEAAKEKALKSGISPRYTFENYITGKNNQLAFAVATAISDRPGEVYNPVFIYSGVGLGKTHLVHAIGNKILQTKPGAKVVYTPGDNFTNEMIEAIKGSKANGKFTTTDFRNKYRKADVLIIDDIQFIAGKEGTQEELFHTFNALYMTQKQIIMTSDKPPKDFKNLEERISSRFNSGIIVDIQPPDFETRVAILQRRRDMFGDNISDEVISYIAETVNSNIRELEGAYLQALTKSQTEGGSMSVEETARELGKTVREKITKNINMNQILNAVCVYYSTKSSDIKGKKRTQELVFPRQIAMYLIKEMTNTPFMSIGDFLGGRDHTTIMHGVEKITGEIEIKTKVRQDITNIKSAVYSE